MSRATGSRAYSGRHRDPKVDESTPVDHYRRKRPHRVEPPTEDQYVDYLIHCAMRTPPGNFNPKTGSMPPGPYTAALGNSASNVPND